MDSTQDPLALLAALGALALTGLLAGGALKVAVARRLAPAVSAGRIFAGAAVDVVVALCVLGVLFATRNASAAYLGWGALVYVAFAGLLNLMMASDVHPAPRPWTAFVLVMPVPLMAAAISFLISRLLYGVVAG